MTNGETSYGRCFQDRTTLGYRREDPLDILPAPCLLRFSNMKSLPEKPTDEVEITVAGPLVNVVLALIFFGVALVLGAGPFMPSHHRGHRPRPIAQPAKREVRRDG